MSARYIYQPDVKTKGEGRKELTYCNSSLAVSWPSTGEEETIERQEKIPSQQRGQEIMDKGEGEGRGKAKYSARCVHSNGVQGVGLCLVRLIVMDVV